MEGHVIWRPVFVRVGDVMDRADGHRDLADRVDNGQVDDGPEAKGQRQWLKKVVYCIGSFEAQYLCSRTDDNSVQNAKQTLKHAQNGGMI